MFRLGEPLEELHRGIDLFLRTGGDHHTGTLLHGHILAARKLRAGQHRHVDVVALGVVHHDLRGEEGGAGVGTHIGQHIAHLDIIAAEATDSGKPPLDEGHIVVVPQLAGYVLVKVQGHLSVLHLEQGVAQLPGPHQHVVGHGVAAEQSLAVVRLRRLGVGPVIIGTGSGHQPFHGGKVVVGGTGGLGKLLPVGLVQEHQLGGFCHREDLHAAVAVKVSFVQVALHILGALVLGKVLAQVHQHAHLVQRIGGVSIGREDVGHGRSTHLALGRIHHVGLQVAHAALAGTFHPDALFAAGGLVELVHQLVEAFQLVTIVIGPHGDMGHPGGAAGFSGALRCAAAGCTAQCQRRSAQQTDECSNVLFHRNALLAFPTAAPTAAYPFNYTTLSGAV